MGLHVEWTIYSRPGGSSSNLIFLSGIPCLTGGALVLAHCLLCTVQLQLRTSGNVLNILFQGIRYMIMNFVVGLFKDLANFCLPRTNIAISPPPLCESIQNILVRLLNHHRDKSQSALAHQKSRCTDSPPP